MQSSFLHHYKNILLKSVVSECTNIGRTMLDGGTNATKSILSPQAMLNLKPHLWRRNDLGMSHAQIEAHMQILVTAFTIEWLNQNTGHPIQALWQRKDELATHELYSLASSIQVLSAINPKWVQEQIKQAKSKEGILAERSETIKVKQTPESSLQGERLGLRTGSRF